MVGELFPSVRLLLGGFLLSRRRLRGFNIGEEEGGKVEEEEDREMRLFRKLGGGLKHE